MVGDVSLLEYFFFLFLIKNIELSFYSPGPSSGAWTVVACGYGVRVSDLFDNLKAFSFGWQLARTSGLAACLEG